MNEKLIKIRFVEESDLPFVQVYCSKKKVSETTSIPYPYPKDGAEQWFKLVSKSKDQGTAYAFSILCENDFAGVISVKQKDNLIGQIDYWVAPPYWNNGVGTTALKKAIDFAFNELGLRTIESYCLSSNIGSRKILEKNGFVLFKEEILEVKKHKGEIFSFYRLGNVSR